MRRALLDTDIFSEVLKGNHPITSDSAEQYLDVYDRLTISTMTVMEMVSGFQQSQQPSRISHLADQIDDHELLTLSTESSVLAGHIYGDLERKGLRIGVADTLIAAIAIDCGLQLVTGNTKHYQRIIDLGYGLDLCNWRETLCGTASR